MCKMRSNGIKTAFFFQKITKNPLDQHSLRRLRAPPPDPLNDTFELHTIHFFTQHVSQFRHFYILTNGLSLPL